MAFPETMRSRVCSREDRVPISDQRNEFTLLAEPTHGSTALNHRLID